METVSLSTIAGLKKAAMIPTNSPSIILIATTNLLSGLIGSAGGFLDNYQAES